MRRKDYDKSTPGIVDDETEFHKYLNKKILKYNQLTKTLVDTDNNGKPETVMFYRSPRCNTARNFEYNIPYFRALFVLDEVKNIIDIKMTEPLLQNPFGHLYDVEGKAMGHLYQIYDIFFYDNQTYFDKWNVRDWTLSVFIQSEGKTEEVCRFKYNWEE